MKTRLALAFALTPASALAQSTWIKKSPTNQPARPFNAAMVFNETAKKVMLFGNSQLSETWEWDGTKWTRLSTSGPTARYTHKMVWDAKRKRVILVHDIGGNATPLRTYTWNGTVWTRITTKTSPPPRAGFNMVYDTKRDVVVLFGGIWGGKYFSETWEFDGTDWRQRSSGGAPRRIFFGMGFDSNRGETFLFGGEGVGSGSSNINLGDTWVWDGRSWFEHFGIAGPDARKRMHTAFDSARNVMVLFGGWNRTGAVADTWEWNGAKWTKANPSVSPKSGGPMAFDPIRKVVVMVREDSRTSETWEYLSKAPVQGSYVSFGRGCAGSTGVPRLAAVGTTPPRVGQTFSVELTNIKPSAFVRAFGIAGASKSTWMGAALPLDLRPFGMPGCQLFASMDTLSNLTIVGGKSTWAFQVPNDPNLAGGRFYLQGLVFEPGANSGGAIVSNAGEGKIGL